MKKIYVIGGTNYDAQLGADILSKYKIASEPISITDSPQEYFFRGQGPTYLQKWIYGKIADIPAELFLVFCNSLSFAIDWETLSKQIGVPILSLTTVYRDLMANFRVVGAIAAHESTLCNIRNFFDREYGKIQIIGYSMLPIVEDIEQGNMHINTVRKLIEISAELGAEAFIFGCTHFEDFVVPNTPIEVIYPGKKLVEFVIQSDYA